MCGKLSHLRRGFTLVELLLVIGIISILIGILLPVLSTARRSARDAKCKSNIRQVVIALHNYAADNKGKFPPNIYRDSGQISVGLLPQVWNHYDRIGRYLPNSRVVRQSPGSEFHDSLLTPVLVCPEDEGASRSYAMNYFASCLVQTTRGRIEAPNFPKAGTAWASNTKESSKLILVGEALSYFSDRMGGWVCGAYIPLGMQRHQTIDEERHYPGVAFVGTQYGIIMSTAPAPERRFIPADTDFDWARHRRRGDGLPSRPAENATPKRAGAPTSASQTATSPVSPRMN